MAKHFRGELGTARTLTNRARRLADAKSDKGSETWTWTGHIPLIIATVSSMTVILRIVASGASDIQTTYGILQATGSNTIIFGTVISVIQFVAPIGLPLTVVSKKLGWIEKGRYGILLYVVGLSAFFLSFLLSPVLLFVAFPMWSIVTYFIARMMARSDESKGGGRDKMNEHVINLFLAPVIGIGCLMAILSPSPWVAPEGIAVAGHSARTGYVLSYSPSNITILWNKPREIHYYDPKNISRKGICVFSKSNLGISEKSLSELLKSFAPRYPACPKD